MARQQIKAEKRDVFGKKVKKLRREGIMPANVYGKDIKSQSLQVPYEEFKKIYKEVGETGLIDLEVGKDSIPVLIHNVQINYNHDVVHADFFKVNLKEKVKAMVPVELIGEAKAVTENIGLIMQITNEIEVEALPTDLPENIEINIEPLATVDQQIAVEDLPKMEGVEYLSDPSQVIVKVAELVSKEAAEQAAEEAAAAEAASAEGATEGVEGEAPAEGETPAQEGEAESGEQAKSEEKPAENQENS